MVSALKVDGRRLHELAREGIEVEREPRPVTVHRFDVDSTPDPLVYRVEVECSSGTYVRSLAADLGHALGGGAHLRALRRTAVGSFTESEAHPVDTLVLQPPAVALRDFAVDGRRRRRRRRGRAREGARRATRSACRATARGPCVDERGALLAVYEPTGKPDTVKPAVVLACRPRDVRVRAVEVIRDGDQCPRPPRAAWSRSAPTTACTSVTAR